MNAEARTLPESGDTLWHLELSHSGPYRRGIIREVLPDGRAIYDDLVHPYLVVARAVVCRKPDFGTGNRAEFVETKGSR